MWGTPSFAEAFVNSMVVGRSLLCDHRLSVIGHRLSGIGHRLSVIVCR